MTRKTKCMIALGAALAATAARAEAPERDEKKDSELARKVDILTDEVQKLRERLVIPEKEVYKSVYGLGPAASRVYLLQRGLSVGGYGEFFVERKVKDERPGELSSGDMLRYVQYFGYKFSDKWVVNAEIEFEHSFTGSGQPGEVAVEFAYLDYLAHPAINIRLGLMLIPMGFLNEIHEPPFFHGVQRPAVERVIIPTTWREVGIGIFGEPLPGLSYKLYTVAGMNAEKFGTGGWRSGRQSGARFISENFAVVGRVDYKFGDLLNVGGAVYYGGADQEKIPNVRANTFLAEGHVQMRYRGLEFRGLATYGTLSDSQDLTLELIPTGTGLIASDLYGWYVEAAYDFWPLISRKNLYLAPYYRYESYNTQYKTPEIAGRTPDRSLDITSHEVGLTFKPHPQIVLKASYRDVSNAASSLASDWFQVGAGFIY